MESGFPILVIVTNKSCSHCVKLRGASGWPSDKLTNGGIPPNKDGKYTNWNNEFFEKALAGGEDDKIQRARIIELSFDKLVYDSNLEEITFFDLDQGQVKAKGEAGIAGRLIVKKYRADDKGKTLLMTKNKNGFVETIRIRIKYKDFIKKYIPLELIRNYIHMFPSWMYVHSTIWDNAIEEGEKDGSLYLRVQGFRTVRDGDNPRKYKILKERKSISEERDKNPIDILKKLIAGDLKTLYYPSDH